MKFQKMVLLEMACCGLILAGCADHSTVKLSGNDRTSVMAEGLDAGTIVCDEDYPESPGYLTFNVCTVTREYFHARTAPLYEEDMTIQ